VSSLQQRFVDLWGGVMHDPANGLRRIPLPRTPVNKGKEKSRGVAAPARSTTTISLRSMGDGRRPSRSSLL